MNSSAIGVVVVTFRSGDVIVECLESLFNSTGVELKVVVVDNASSDDTVEVIRGWANGQTPYVRPAASPLPERDPIEKPIELLELDESEATRGGLGRLTLVHSRLNRGYGGGVNLGLKALQNEVGLYWVLNPDCAAPPGTARAFVEAAQANDGFGLMSCPVIYYGRPDRIQSAGGSVNRFTGVCSHRLADAPVSDLSAPKPGELDWVSGANLVASKRFLQAVGLMREDYFLYFEEVDWAFRRGDLPIVFLTDAVVYHHGGTAIGSGSMMQRASAFSEYLNYRNRIRFSRRFLGRPPLGAYLYGLAKAAQSLLRGEVEQATAIVAGVLELRPPRLVASRIDDPEVAALAFGPGES